MAHTPEIWTTQGFLDHVMELEKLMPDRAFCFILGAGASVPSNIPAGGELVDGWLKELHARLDHGGRSLEEWATAENLGIDGFDLARAATFYPQVFERRFPNDPEAGYAYLEKVMEGRDPSLGYSILAQILDKTRHQVVITTNFDNLVADAMGIYTQTHPLVAAHESLTEFVRAKLRRPLVAKIHRDLFFAPKNDQQGVSELEKGWPSALKLLFSHYTPIFIGYGGNDGSLMGLLEELPEETMSGGLFWCYRDGGGPPDERIAEVVSRHKGCFVPILGFDELMLQLGDRFGYPLLADEIVEQAKATAKRYREQVEAIQQRLKEGRGVDEESSAVKQALAATVERKDDWWSWQLKVRGTEDNDEKERLFREGMEHCSSANLAGNFANFMVDVREDYDEAERLYRCALELDPKHANVTGNLALFMKNARGEYDEAERLYRRALELDPEHASNTGNFAVFLQDIREEYDEAERFFRRALELDPAHANIIGNFARFMENVREEYDEAERLYRRVLELDPDHTLHTGNLAELMLMLDRSEEAETFTKRMCELASPNDSASLAVAEFHLLVIDCLRDGDETSTLARLKGLLISGAELRTWSFERLLKKVEGRLEEEGRRLYRLITEAINDNSRLPALEEIPRWRDLEPILPEHTR